MTFAHIGRNASIGCVAALLLGGCGGSQLQQRAGALPQTIPLARSAPAAPRADSRLKKQDLLYVSDGNGEVTVYRYWKHTLVGVLTNFTQPMGECTDKKGNIFITDYATKHIVEYAHGGTKPLQVLDDAPYGPYGCSVNPVNGSLAVANRDGGPSGTGNLAVFAHARGTPLLYTDSELVNFESCAYDDHGNLLATDGSANRSLSSFAWLPRTTKHLIDIKLPEPSPYWQWKNVQGIQWDGTYWAIEEGQIVRESIMNGLAYYVGTIQLDEDTATGPMVIYPPTPKKQGTQIVGGWSEEFGGAGVNFWKYPSGSHLTGFTHGVDQPYGVAISLRQ